MGLTVQSRGQAEYRTVGLEIERVSVHKNERIGVCKKESSNAGPQPSPMDCLMKV